VESVDFWVSLALSRELGIRKMYSNLVETAPTNPRSSALGGVPKTPQGEFPKLKIVGRLKPGMTRESAEAALLAYGLGITLVGVAAGLAGAIGLTRFLQSLLFNITASDPITYLNIAALFGAVTMLASSVPARKAMRVDPAIMLRNE
jgi:hypothetical protein